MKVEKEFLFNVISLLCGLWFLLTGWAWTYLTSLFVAYPVGILGFVFWYQGRKINPGSVFNKIALGILVAGLIVSIGAIFIYK